MVGHAPDSHYLAIEYDPSTAGMICPNPPASLPTPPGSSGGGLVGSGSPQGIVSASAGTTYYDKTAGQFWVNQDGTINGWIELIS